MHVQNVLTIQPFSLCPLFLSAYNCITTHLVLCLLFFIITQKERFPHTFMSQRKPIQSSFFCLHATSSFLLKRSLLTLSLPYTYPSFLSNTTFVLVFLSHSTFPLSPYFFLFHSLLFSPCKQTYHQVFIRTQHCLANLLTI